MPTAHNTPATLLANGKVLVSGGGGTGSGGVLYDPSTAKCTPTGAFYYGDGTGENATLLGNDNVLMYGNHFSCYAGQVFNPSTNCAYRKCQSDICLMVPDKNPRIPISLRIRRSLGL